MAIIDFLILGLVLISFTINLLAIGAFWVTPGLRTTANRFVVNLLIINLVGCCILAPTLILIGNQNTVHSNVDSLDIMKRKNTTIHHQRLPKYTHMMMQDNGDDIQNEFGNKIEIPRAELNKYTDMIIDPIDEQKILESTQLMRLWSIDLAAALGTLSVLLVVGDTWMAVRDPLHYHSRISRVKAWVLITMTWTLGIFFGMISAYREINFECITVIEKKRNVLSEQIEELTLTTSTIFNMIFAYIYFLLIILLPFGFVCGMYWRIYSEAKGNDVKKLKNRSSPLLQSTNNLYHNHQQQERTILLKMKKNLSNISLDKDIDSNRNNEEEKVSIAEPLSRFLPLSNVNGEINRFPFKSVLVRSSDRVYAIRQIYSTPNFQKFNQGYSTFLTAFEPKSNLRYMAQQALQIPTTHISKRSFNYMISVFKHREESRAARISILVVIMFLVSYLPYGFLVLLQGSQVIENFPYSTQLAVFMIILANLSSPFIFAYRNKRVRHGVTRLLGFYIRSRKYPSKLYAYSKNSCKYLAPVLNDSPKSLLSPKYNENTVGTYTYLTNSASVQSSIIFGHIAIVNTTVDVRFTYDKESILKI